MALGEEIREIDQRHRRGDGLHRARHHPSTVTLCKMSLSIPRPIQRDALELELEGVDRPGKMRSATMVAMTGGQHERQDEFVVARHPKTMRMAVMGCGVRRRQRRHMPTMA